MPFTHVDDISLYDEVHGENGSPLIVIHGYNACSREQVLKDVEAWLETRRQWCHS